MPYINGIYTNPGWTDDAPPPLDEDNLNDLSNAVADVTSKQQYQSNPNLLDNWYFVGGGMVKKSRTLPINQRYLLSYNTNCGMSIDRWRVLNNSSNGSITIEDAYITIKAKNGDGIYQTFEQSALDGEYTISVLTADGELYYENFSISSDTPDGQQDFKYNGTNIWSFMITKGNNYIHVCPIITFSQSQVQAVNIIAVKLERGSNQTLAILNSNNKWVLNDSVPSFEDELLKCSRYYSLVSAELYSRTNNSVYYLSPIIQVLNSSGMLEGLINMPCIMRAKPSISTKSGYLFEIHGQNTYYDISFYFRDVYLGEDGNMKIVGTVSPSENIQPGLYYVQTAEEGAGIILNAEL